MIGRTDRVERNILIRGLLDETACSRQEKIVVINRYSIMELTCNGCEIDMVIGLGPYMSGGTSLGRDSGDAESAIEVEPV